MEEISLPGVKAPALPRETWRDYVNDIRQDFKFRWMPFRAYYRFRAYKYMWRRDPEMGLLKFLIDPARISLDVGANLGLFTYFMARFSPRVIAFEPNPNPLRVLRSVVDRNVEIVPAAVGNQDGPVTLNVPRNRKGWSSNGAGLGKAGATSFPVEVTGIKLDSLKLPPVGFIKIDVEGHELAVLEGARDLIRRDHPAIFLETEYLHAGDKIFDVFRFCKEMGYRGMFLSANGLTDISLFDVETHQKQRGPGYVKNFIFIPASPDA